MNVPADVFVTHVEKDGLFLKIYGQTDRSSGIHVERYIIQITDHIERNTVNPVALKVGQVLCARYSDGSYYRARIESLQSLPSGLVTVKFIDYGNVNTLTLNNLKLLDSPIFDPLIQIPDQARAFCVAGVMARSNSNEWGDDIMKIIKDLILYVDMKYTVVFKTGDRMLARFYLNGDDLAGFLIQKGIGTSVSEQAQQTVIQTCVDPPPPMPYMPPVFNVPPPIPIPSNFQTFNMNHLLTAPSVGITSVPQVKPVVSLHSPVQAEVKAYKSITLDVLSEHSVYVSYIENGPSAFTVQLQSNENLLNSLMHKINRTAPLPLNAPPMPGTVCLGRYSEDGKLCRAVIMALKGDKCQVYYVDFGNNEELSCSDIFEIPDQFAKPNAMAIRFCVAGLSDLGSVTDEMKELFSEIVNDKVLQLRVTPPEGPLMQYGDFFYNGQNIKQMLKKARPTVCKYLPPQILEVNSNSMVIISFMNSPISFYVQCVDYSDALNAVMESVKEHCEVTSPLCLEAIHVGMPCCALFKDDGQWYRAQALSVSQTGVEVFYVDYGNFDTVQVSDLRPSNRELLMTLQAQAIHCTLNGFEETGEDITALFEELTVEKDLKMVVLGHNGDVLEVDLYDTSVTPAVSIAAKLKSSQPAERPAAQSLGVPHSYNAAAEDCEWTENTPVTAPPAENNWERKKFSGKDKSFGSGRFSHNYKNQGGNRSSEPNMRYGKQRFDHSEDKPWRKQNENYEDRKPRREDNWRENADSSELGSRRRNDSRSDGREREDRFSSKRMNADSSESNVTGFGKWGGKKDDKWNSLKVTEEEQGSDRWNNRRGGDRRNDRWGSANDSKFSGADNSTEKGWDDDANGESNKWDKNDGGNRKRFNSDDEPFSRGNRNRFGSQDDDDGGSRKFGRRDNNEDGGSRKFGRRNDNEEGSFRKFDRRDNGGDFRKDGGGRFNRRDENEDGDGGGRQFRRRDDNDGGFQGRRGRFNSQEEGDGSFRGKFSRRDESDDGNKKPWQKRDDFRGSNRDNFRSTSFNQPVVETTTDVGGDNWDDEPQTSAKTGTTLPAATVSLGTKESVEVVFLNTPADFYVQKKSQSEALASLMNNIATYADGGGSTPFSLSAGGLCIARYTEDETWYRASVISVTNSNARVQFVDYGNEDDVPLTSILEMSPDFTNIPIQAISCTLLGVKPMETEWSEEEINNFSSLAEGKEIEAHFVRKTEKSYEVILTDTETNEIINEKLGCTPDVIKDALSPPKPKSTFGFTPFTPSMPSTEFVPVSLSDRFLPFDLNPDHTEQVTLSWFISPSEFYCQLVSQQQNLFDTMNNIQKLYCRRPSLMSNVVEGSPVIARFQSDRVLYRAEIKETKPFFQYVVQFVDFGNCSLVGKSDLWEVERRFLEMPKQAVLCALKNVSPIDGDWETLRSEIEQLFSVGQFECTFHELVDGKYSVTLKQNGISIADSMISSGLAKEQISDTDKIDAIQYDLLPGKTFRAQITYVDGVDKFFIHINPAQSLYIQDMIKQYLCTPQEPLPVDQIQVGTLCISSPDAQEWYRARVEEVGDNIYVTFIDFGDGDEVPQERLLPISETLSTFPAVAVECYLTRNDVEVSDELQDKFKETLESQEVIVHVDSVIEERLSVSLYDTKGKKFELLPEFGTLPQVEPLCPLLITGPDRVFVSHVEEPTKVWIQLAKDSDILAKLLDDMFTFYATDAKGCEADLTTMFCAAKSDKDENWYRAKIESESGELKAMFVDYGNSEVVQKENIKMLDESFYVPSCLATIISLPLVCSVKAEEFSSQLSELTADKELLTCFAYVGSTLYTDLIDDGKSLSKQLEKLGLGTTNEEFPFIEEHTPEIESGLYSVFVSHIESPSVFWIQMAQDATYIEELQQELQTTAPDFQTVEVLSEAGPVFAAQYSDDNNWYRAKCIGENEAETTVCFIDYGNTDVVDITAGSIKKLPERLQNIPGYAAKYHLDLLPVDSSEWTEKALERFEGLVAEVDGPLSAKVLTNTPEIFVNIFVNDKEIAQTLIEEGLAVPGNKVSEMSPLTGLEKYSYDTNVFVSYGNTPSDFWIQVEKDNDLLNEMLEKMANAETFDAADNVTSGTIIGAQHHEDDQWYRAELLSNDNGSFSVLFIDYGNRATVSEIRALPSELSSVRPLATNCTLVLPTGVDSWPEDVNDKFVELVTDENAVFQMDIVNKESPMCISLLYNGSKVEEILSPLCKVKSDSLATDTKPETVLHDSPPLEITCFDATISHMKSPDEFWIQKDSTSAQLLEVTDLLMQWESYEPLSDLKEGDLCAALFPDDEIWYRAKVLTEGAEGTTVLYIDYGNSSVSSEFRKLPKELLTVPPLAKHCALELPENIGIWPDGALEKFDELVGANEDVFQVEILKDGEPSIVKLMQNGKDVVSQLIEAEDSQNENATDKSVSESVCVDADIDTAKDSITENDTPTVSNEVVEPDFSGTSEDVTNAAEDCASIKVSNSKELLEDSEDLNISMEGSTESRETADILKIDSSPSKLVNTEIENTQCDEIFFDTTSVSEDVNSEVTVATNIEPVENETKVEVTNATNIESVENETKVTSVSPNVEVVETKECIKVENSELNLPVTIDETSIAEVCVEENGISDIENGLLECSSEEIKSISQENDESQTTVTETVSDIKNHIKENGLSKSEESHKHIDTIVTEVSFEMKTPVSTSKSLSHPSTPKLSRSEKIVPGSISRGLSQEEIYSALSEPLPAIPKVPFAEKIVAGAVSSCSLDEVDITLEEQPNDLPSDICQETPAAVPPKLLHSERIVPGCISHESE